MACAYHVNAGHDLVLFRPNGRFGGDDFIALCRAAYDDPRRTPQFSHVWDTRSIDELVMEVDVISTYRAFLSENQERLTEEKVAIIATRAMTRTFASMLVQVSKQSPATFQLFNSVQAAADWIGVPGTALTGVPEQDWSEV